MPSKLLLVAWLFFGLLGGSQVSAPARIEVPTIVTESEARFDEQAPAPEFRATGNLVKRSQKGFEKAEIERIRQSQVRPETSSQTKPGAPPDLQDSRPTSEMTELTPYEQGVLLARRFMQEKAAAEMFQDNVRTQSSARDRDINSKREIELKAQERLRHPF